MLDLMENIQELDKKDLEQNGKLYKHEGGKEALRDMERETRLCACLSQ
jgi:hypothetical protein